MKALKITNVSPNFASFCVALNIRFAYSYGDFYVFGTLSPEKFRAFCNKQGLRDWDMNIEPCDFEEDF